MNTPKLVRGRWIIPGADDAVLVDGAVLVQGGDIAAVDDWRTLREKYPDAEVVGSENMVVLPGLINAHHHSKGISTIQHGVADMLLEPWILSLRRTRHGDPHLEALLSAAEQLLDRSDVVACLEQVRRERVPERVTSYVFHHPGPVYRFLHGSLQDRLVDVMPALLAGPRVLPPLLLREDPLPLPFGRSIWVLAIQRVG